MDDTRHCPSNAVEDNIVARVHAPPLIGIRSVLVFGHVFADRKHQAPVMHRTQFLSGHGRLRGRCWRL